MELHRLDGLSATGLDNLDIQDVDYDMVDNTIYEIGSLETLEGLGTVDNKLLTHEILDEHGNVVMYADEQENLYMVNGLEGFFKKIGRGFKKIGRFVKKAVIKPIGKAVKFVGKKVLKPAFKAFNRFLNPVTILLRNGFLLAMKINLFKVAERLRFGYLSDGEAKKRGMSPSGFAKIKKIVSKAMKIYEGAGGKSKNLRKAILTGKGNKDKGVPLSGFALGAIQEESHTYTDDFERFVTEADPEVIEEFMQSQEGIVVEGLGAVASSAAITAASSAVAGVAALLSKVTGVFDKANKAKDQVKQFIQPFNSKPAPVATPTASLRQIRRFSPTIPQGGPTRSGNPFGLRRTGGFIPSMTTTPATPQKESVLKKYKTPLLIGAGVLLIGGVIVYTNKNKNKKKTRANTSVNGLPKGKKKRDELGRFVGTGSRRKPKTARGSKNALPKKFAPKALL